MLLILVLTLCSFLSTAADQQRVQFQGWVLYGENEPSPSYEIIHNERELDEFRKRIPRERPSIKEPAPPNEDPFLSYQPDFQKVVLVVALRSRTISAYPSLHCSRDSGSETVLMFELPEPPPEARPYGWGTYQALELPRARYRLEFK